eukprot:SAG31_NODE_7557_length_1655_cov_1.075835_1_plen_363_part_10
MSWQLAQLPSKLDATPLHSVGVQLVGDEHWEWVSVPSADDESQPSHTIDRLQSGRAYLVVVRDERTGRVSDPLMMRTKVPGAMYTPAYRISEFADSVDFLENHDAASKGSMPLYIQNGGGYDERDGEKNAGGNHTMDMCLETMAELCPTERGNAFHCMACADKHRAAVTDGCGVWGDADGTDGFFGAQLIRSAFFYGSVSFWLKKVCVMICDCDTTVAHHAVHFYCGVGWPGSSFQRSPITEYCVEHLPAPQTDPLPGGDGFAQYISCNSDECDGAKIATGGSSPRDPVCVCWVWDDRMISQLPKSKLLADCSPDVHLPWVGANQCNCSKGLPGSAATQLPPDSAMANYVGRSPVYLPYCAII